MLHPTGLTKLANEHYKVARSFSGRFSRQDFLAQYAKMYPPRTQGSIIPSDYCVNHSNAGNGCFPRFLRREGRGLYSFVGLADGTK